jgi:hypothetical protein
MNRSRRLQIFVQKPTAEGGGRSNASPIGSLDILFEDDVTVILLSVISYMEPAHPLPTRPQKTVGLRK